MKFKEGDRVWVTIGKDLGGEQPEGKVVDPTEPYVLIRMDPEFGGELREYHIKDLEVIK